MTEPFRDRFLALGVTPATRSFPGEGGRPLWYAELREPGDEDDRHALKGRQYLVDLHDGRWSKWGEPWKSFDQWGVADSAPAVAVSGDHEKSRPTAGIRGESHDGAEANGTMPAGPGAGSDTSSDFARNPAPLPASVETWFSECLAAGFEIIAGGGRHSIGGQDTCNRFARYDGRVELLCGHTRRILDERCDKWTLAEYVARRAAGGAVPRPVLDERPTPRPFLVEHPTAPRPAIARSLF